MPPFRTDLYRDPGDRPAVLRLCEGVYGGSDYLPNRLPALAADPRCCSVVLRDLSGTAIAFANARALHAARPRAPSLPPLFLEAVRVLPSAYGQGLGTTVVRAATLRARKELCGNEPSGDYSGSCGSAINKAPPILKAADVVTVTIEANAVMIRILRRAGFVPCGSGRLHIWPERVTFEGVARGGGVPLLSALGVEARIPMAARALLDAWTPLPDAQKLLAACAAARTEPRTDVADGSPRASGFVPGYYDLAAAEGVGEALELGDATAWALPEGFGVVVVQSNPSITNKDDRVVLSVLAKSIELAEAAVVFADRRLCLPRFRAIFDSSISELELRKSPLLGSVAAQSFDAFILRGDLL